MASDNEDTQEYYRAIRQGAVAALIAKWRKEANDEREAAGEAGRKGISIAAARLGEAADVLEACADGLAALSLEPAPCDCGAALVQCAGCAVGDYQAAHPTCATCCPPAVVPALSGQQE